MTPFWWFGHCSVLHGDSWTYYNFRMEALCYESAMIEAYRIIRANRAVFRNLSIFKDR